MPRILLVFDGHPTTAQIAREARAVLSKHSRRDRHEQRADAARGRDAVRKILVERICSTIVLHAAARRARAEVQL